MKEYKCLRCEYHFCSENEIPYCPAYECESLEEIEDEVIVKEIELESHHIHPRFMDNKRGKGQQFNILKKKHSILHNKIMNWLWKEIPENRKAIVIKNIINKSKSFLGVK